MRSGQRTRRHPPWRYAKPPEKLVRAARYRHRRGASGPLCRHRGHPANPEQKARRAGAVCSRSLQRLFLRCDAAVLFRHRGDLYRRLQQRQRRFAGADGAGGGLRPRGDQGRYRSGGFLLHAGGPRLCAAAGVPARRARQAAGSAGVYQRRRLAAAGLSAYPHAGRSHRPLSDHPQ